MPKTLKERRAEAEELVNDIVKQLEIAEKSANESLDHVKSINRRKNEVTKLGTRINQVTTNAENSISEIRETRDRLKRLLTTVNNFHDKRYLPLKEKIENPESGFKASIKKVTEDKREFEKLKDQHERQVTDIKKLVESARKNLADIKKIDSSLRTIKGKIEAYAESAHTSKVNIDDAEKEINTSLERIRESAREIEIKENEISEFHSSSQGAKEEIDEFHSEANKKLEAIKVIYKVAAGTGLGGEFDKRKRALETQMKTWNQRTFTSTLVLFSAIVGLFILQLGSSNWNVNQITFDGNFYARFLIVSPIIFYLVFASRQSLRTRKMLEKYAFKSALALSIDAHINLLTNIENLQDKEYLNKICDFILKGFDKIYNEPHLDSKSSKTNVPLVDELKTAIKELQNEQTEK